MVIFSFRDGLAHTCPMDTPKRWQEQRQLHRQLRNPKVEVERPLTEQPFLNRRSKKADDGGTPLRTVMTTQDRFAQESENDKKINSTLS